MLKQFDITDCEIQLELEEAIAFEDTQHVAELIDEIESRGHEIQI